MNVRGRGITSFLIIALGARVLAAQGGASGDAPPLTLSTAVARAMQANPDVRLAHLRGDSSRAEVHIARSYANPGFAVTPNNPWQYSVAAPLDIGPQRTYRVRTANDGALALTHDVHDTERLVRFSVRSAFYDLILADTLRAIAREQRDMFRDLLAADSARVRAGDMPERNLTKSELELAKSGAAVARADAEVRAARLALQAAIGIASPDTGLRVVGSLAAPPVAPDLAVDDSIVARRSDVRAAAERTRGSEDARRFAAALLVPVPGLQLVQQRTDPFPNGQHYAIGITAQLPVWNWFSGERERAEAGVRASQVSEERVRVQAYTEITNAIDQFHAADRLARTFDAALLEKARASLETARFAYSSGAISYVDFLDAVRTYGEIRADAAAAGHDYWVSAYAVSRALDKEVVQP